MDLHWIQSVLARMYPKCFILKYCVVSVHLLFHMLMHSCSLGMHIYFIAGLSIAESLQKTKESTPPQATLQTLIEQLQRTAQDLRSGGSSSDADKLEKAASRIQEVASLDLTVIDRAASSVTKQVSCQRKLPPLRS